VPWPKAEAMSTRHGGRSLGSTCRRREPGQQIAIPYPIDAGALFVCFGAHAELGCHMALGWPLPRKILDLSPEFRGLVNGCTIAERKGLLGVLAYFGLDNIGTVRKDAMRTRIMQGKRCLR
jgi:hypothetical protein